MTTHSSSDSLSPYSPVVLDLMVSGMMLPFLLILIGQGQGQSGYLYLSQWSESLLRGIRLPPIADAHPSSPGDESDRG